MMRTNNNMTENRSMLNNNMTENRSMSNNNMTEKRSMSKMKVMKYGAAVCMLAAMMALGTPAGMAQGYAPNSTGTGTVTNSNPGYAIYNGTYYIGGSSIMGSRTFQPRSCVWTSTNDKWKNSADYYLSFVAGLFSSGLGLTSNLPDATSYFMSGTESGTTGRYLYSVFDGDKQYMTYGSKWIQSSTDSAACVFTIAKHEYTPTWQSPVIGCNSELYPGNIQLTVSTAASLNPEMAYVDYEFCNNAHHYYLADNVTALATACPAATFNYVWTMTGVDSLYATLNSSTGVLSYVNPVPTETEVTITLTATSRTYGQVLTGTKRVTLKPLVLTSASEVSSGIFHVYALRNMGTGEYLRDKQDATMHYVAAQSGNLADSVTHGVMGWYFMDAGAGYVYIRNYQTGAYLYCNYTAGAREHSILVSAEMPAGNSGKFLLDAIRNENGIGMAIKPYGTTGLSVYPYSTNSGDAGTYLATASATALWQPQIVQMLRSISTTPVQLAAQQNVALGAITPDGGSVPYGGGDLFTVTPSALTVNPVIERPSYREYRRNDNVARYYWSSTEQSENLSFHSNAPEVISAEGGWSGTMVQTQVTRYHWTLADYNGTNALENLSFAAHTARADTTAARRNNGNGEITVYNYHQNANLTTRRQATLSVEAIYENVDALGNTFTFRSATSSTTAGAVQSLSLIEYTTNARDSIYAYCLVNFNRGALSDTITGTRRNANATTANTVTVSGGQNTADRYWYLVRTADNDGSVYVVNLLTKRYLYCTGTAGNNTVTTRYSATAPAESNYKFTMSNVTVDGIGYLRLSPKNAAGYYVRSNDANNSGNINMTNAGSGDAYNYTLWRNYKELVCVIAPQVSNVELLTATLDAAVDTMLTTTGEYRYGASCAIVPPHYMLNGYNYYYTVANGVWTRGTGQTIIATTDQPYVPGIAQIEWSLRAGARDGAVVAGGNYIDNGNTTNKAYINYNTLATGHGIDTLEAHFTYAGYPDASVQQWLIHYGGTAAPTSITVTPEVVGTETRLPYSLTYELEPSYAYDSVVCTTSDNTVAPVSGWSRGGRINLTAGNSLGIATVTLTAYGRGLSTGVTATVTVNTYTACATPSYTDGAAYFHGETLKISNGTESGANVDTIYYTTNGTDPTVEGSSSILSGGSISVAECEDGAIVKALAWRDGHAESDIAQYTVNRYDAPEVTDHVSKNQLDVKNGERAGDGTSHVRYTVNGLAPQYSTPTTVTGASADTAVSIAVLARGTAVSLRTYGDTKYPSEMVKRNIMRYTKPHIDNYTPYSDALSTNLTGRIYSNGGSCIYVNSDKFEVDGVTLKDPNPWDPTTYTIKVSTGTNISLAVGRIKAVAAVCNTEGVRGEVLYTSRVAVIDQNYTPYIAFQYTDGTNERFLSLNHETRQMETSTEFDQYCLWKRNLSSFISQTFNSTTYYLGVNSDNRLFITTDTNAATRFVDWDNKLYRLTRDGRFVSPTQVVQLGGNGVWSTTMVIDGVNSQIAYLVKTDQRDESEHRVLRDFYIDSIASDSTGKAYDAYSLHKYRTWLAMDQSGERYSLSVQPHVSYRTHTLPAYTYYYFDDRTSTSNNFVYYSSHSYRSEMDLPHTERDENSTASTNVTYHWVLTGNEAGAFASVSSTTNKQIVQRTATAVDRPKRARLTVWARYDDGETAMNAYTDTVTLIAESRTTLLTSNTGDGFLNDRVYVLVSYADTAYRVSFSDGSANGVDNPAVLSVRAGHNSLWRMRAVQDGANYYYTFNSINSGNPLVWNHDTSSVQDNPAVYVGRPAVAADSQFVLTPYADAENGVYFTLEPRRVATNHPYHYLSLTPYGAAFSENNSLRLINYHRSNNLYYVNQWVNSYYDSPVSAFELSRLQLRTPKMPEPGIYMDENGIVSLVDSVSILNSVDVTIYYKLCRLGGSWSADWLTYYEADKPRLELGDKIKAYSVATGSYSYFLPSEVTDEFTALKVSTPVIYSNGNLIAFEATTTTTGEPIEGARFYYTLDGSTVPTSDIGLRFSEPYDTLRANYTVKCVAYADNYLKSDVATLGFTTKLELVMDVTGTSTYNVTLGVINGSVTQGTHYNIYYTTDGTTPTTSSTLYNGQFQLTGYALVKARAITRNPSVCSTSDVVTRFVGKQLYVLNYNANGGTSSDTNFMYVTDGGDLNNDNVPHYTSFVVGPATGNVGGDLFYSYVNDGYLGCHVSGVPIAAVTSAVEASLWIYEPATHRLHTAAGDYVAFDAAQSKWTVCELTDGNPPANHYVNVCFPADTQTHLQDTIVTVTPNELHFSLMQPARWTGAVEGLGINRPEWDVYDMDGNWLSVNSGDTMKVFSSVMATVDSLIRLEHVDLSIRDNVGGSELQSWHHLPDRDRFTARESEVSTEKLVTIDAHRLGGHVVWTFNSTTKRPETNAADRSGAFNSYINYVFVGAPDYDTLCLIRNNTATSGPDFSGRLSVEATVPSGGVSYNFPRQTGYVYAETRDNGNLSISSSQTYKLTAMNDNTRYLSILAGSEADHEYVGDEPIIGLQSHYNRYALWQFRQVRNSTDNSRVWHIYNYFQPEDSVVWINNWCWEKDTYGSIYLYNPVSNAAYAWKVSHPDPIGGGNSTKCDFAINLNKGGYVTISPYNNNGTETWAKRSSQRLSLIENSNTATSTRYSHIGLAYTYWGKGHYNPSNDTTTFYKCRWKLAPATLVEPLVSMNPSGEVTFEHDFLTAPDAELRNATKIFYTLNGDTPTSTESATNMIYDPANKPVMTYGQTLKAVAYINYQSTEQTSPVVTFTPERCVAPTIAEGEGGTFVINHTAGDSVKYSLNSAVIAWDCGAPDCKLYEDGRQISMEDGDIYRMVAFKHNYFESEIASYYHVNKLELNLAYTPSTTDGVTTTAPEVALTVPGALPGFYAIYWTVDNSVDMAHLNQASLPATVHVYTGPVNDTLTVLPRNTSTIFRAVAMSTGTVTYYEASDVVQQPVMWGFGSGQTLQYGTGTQSDPYQIHTAGDLMIVAGNTALRSGYFKVMEDIDATGCSVPSIGGADFSGNWDGNYKVIKGLVNPMFESTYDAWVYNTMLDAANISATGDYCGAIVGQAKGDTRVFNSGVIAKSGVSRVSGTRYVGGLVGYLADDSRVVNCYNYASVSASAANGYAGGLVGYQVTASDVSSIGAIVFNCMNYGDVLSVQTVAPVVGGNATSNVAPNGINTYLYYAHEVELTGTTIAYNAAIDVEKRYIERYPLYRYILNSNLEKSGYFINSVLSSQNVGKWVLDRNVAPYPVVLCPMGRRTTGEFNKYIVSNSATYPSTEGNAYEGKRLGMLNVTINRGAYGTGAASTTVAIPITDIDTPNFDYNYYKIQLPYYQEYFDYSNSEAKIVTGWKVTSVTKNGSTLTSFVSGDLQHYNYADRSNPTKDIYDATNNKYRVFAQGGYYNVPEGVTAITIEAYWAKAIYLQDQYYDVTFNASDYGGRTNVTFYGTRPTQYHGQTVKTSIDAALNALTNENTVYDQAIVLVGNCHYRHERGNNGWYNSTSKPFTIMSADDDKDLEPDNVMVHQHEGRRNINPVRFDFMGNPGLSMTSMPTGSATQAIHGIWQPNGHFEITETCIARYSQFEYYYKNNSQPIILNGGIFENMLSTKSDPATALSYIQMGGHVWMRLFTPGCHSDVSKMTKHCPIIVTGGEYEEFYLSGMTNPNAPENNEDPYLFANGGRFGTYASGGMEKIPANVTVECDHIIADEFYGGGINAAKPITGNISVTVNNSKIGLYVGGPKFGDMSSGKTVTTNATNTVFGTYFGAGYGGTAIYRDRVCQDPVNSPNYNWSVCFTGDSPTVSWGGRSGVLNYKVNRGKKFNNGVLVGYDWDLLPGSGGISSLKSVARLYYHYATLSRANTRGVSNTLVGCTVKNDFYGAGYVGTTTGDVNTTLTDCTIEGSAYGAGYSAKVPMCGVDAVPTVYPYYTVQTSYYDVPPVNDKTYYTWNTVSGSIPNGTDCLDNTDYLIKTTASTSGLGTVTGNVSLTIDGNSYINGDVYGGGDEASVSGNTTVVIKDLTYVDGDVFGAGNLAVVTGNTSLTVGSADGSDKPYLYGDVYAGGNQADVGAAASNNSTTSVTINTGAMGSVYGGGNEGSVFGSTVVNVNGGWIGYEYSAEGDVNRENPVKVPVDFGDTRLTDVVCGAGYGIGTTVTKTTTVNIGNASSMAGDVHIFGSVYGGGEEGQVGGGYIRRNVKSGENVSSGYYTMDPADSLIKSMTGVATAPCDTFYYKKYDPSTYGAGWDNITSRVTVKSDGTNKVFVEGAVFGAGRGFYSEYEEHKGKYSTYANHSPEKEIRGTIYGNTIAEVGTVGQDTSMITIKTMNYYTTWEEAKSYGLVGSSALSGAVFWEQSLFVKDADYGAIVELTPGILGNKINAEGRDGSKVLNFDPGRLDVVKNVQYYLNTGRVSVAGGGEEGAVVGNYNGTYSSSGKGGNSTVIVHSGTLGDVQYHTRSGENFGEVNGCVYGAGISADIDGVSRIIFDGPTIHCRGDVYAGGCMGAVHAYKRASAGTAVTATQVTFEQGWARNVHAGSNLAPTPAGNNAVLTIGKAEWSDDGYRESEWNNTLVSESCYGGNGFSGSDAVTYVDMYSGKVGYVLSGYDINLVGDAVNKNHRHADNGVVAAPFDVPKNVVVSNHQGELLYEGALYGAGFGPQAHVRSSNVTLHGGSVRNGVYGAGEMGAVIAMTGDGEPLGSYRHTKVESDGTVKNVWTPYYAGATANVEMRGGIAAMVCGGGRGYSNFLQVEGDLPGAVCGNTNVTISGGTVDTIKYDYDLGGGSVFGGGLEGVVTGNTTVTISGGHVKGRVYGGGRGFRGAIEGKYYDSSENIKDRAAVNAGAVLGNTSVSLARDCEAIVEKGVYGGGEGCNYITPTASGQRKDTVGVVYGNATVDIAGGVIGLGLNYAGVSENGSYAGGRIAPVYGYADMLVHGTAEVASVFGGNDISGFVGGRGRSNTVSLYRSEVDGSSPLLSRDSTATYVKIYETPRVGHVYGGGNGDYTYYDDQAYAALALTKPHQKSTYIDIKIDRTLRENHANAGRPISGYVMQAFGGGNAATVDTARVHVYGLGLVDTLFGGGNSATVTRMARILLNANPVRTGSGSTQNTDNINNVNTLFGGNNAAAMSIMPAIDLNSGIVDKLYAGGNAGAMLARQTVTDLFGRSLGNVSTYLLVNSDSLTVRTALYAGCNCARVAGGTFVDVRKTTTQAAAGRTVYGIGSLFGSNDISDTVKEARIDMTGGYVHNLFGGGNGQYNYTRQGNFYVVTPYGVPYNGVNAFVDRSPGRPYVATTHVNVMGGTIDNNIYGGGYAGDCGNTYLFVNDTVTYNGHQVSATGTARVSGKIFGGGYGDETMIGNKAYSNAHVGNVTGTATTDLYHLHELGEAYAYGGGNAGDVNNTCFTVHPSWNHSFVNIYGGCRASHVKGTANTYINATDTTMDVAQALYGGNDFGGTVANSNLVVRGGRYTNIYGAGNGDYNYYADPAITALPGGTQIDTVPVSQRVRTTIYNAHVIRNAYGGSNMGYVMTDSAYHSNVADYARIELNVHGGMFERSIFTGSHGKAGGNQLAYALKQFNMDGGKVLISVYGGSENVNDGYPAECHSPSNTTRRPSSVLNFTGGEITNNVYGGGYLGRIYGSVYINVGAQAVNDCPVWTTRYETSPMMGSREYTGSGTGYDVYKPTFVTTDEADTASNLKANDLYLRQSIYNGSDWGTGSGEYVFNHVGFYGGVSNILIDGTGYNTSFSDEGSSLPAMDIYYSIIGSGTSCEGGDISRKIIMRNYGEYTCNGNEPAFSKEIFSVQRADSVIFDNVNVAIHGEQDAYTAFLSPKYSMCRVDTVIFHDENIVALKAPAVFVGNMRFEHADGSLVNRSEDMSTMYGYSINPDAPQYAGSAFTAARAAAEARFPSGMANRQDSINRYMDTVSLLENVCDSIPICVKMRSDMPFTKLYVVDGVYVDILGFTDNGGTGENANDAYGSIDGYCFLYSAPGTEAYISARHKTPQDNATDGGFFSSCDRENKVECSFNTSCIELGFDNYPTAGYRTWVLGSGEKSRKRQVTIVAHSDVRNLPGSNMRIDIPYKKTDLTDSTESLHLALAHANLMLPPIPVGHYFTIDAMYVDQANDGQMRLLKAAVGEDGNRAVWKYMNDAVPTPGSGIPVDGRDISADPDYTFGLIFMTKNRFGSPSVDCYPEGDGMRCYDHSLVSGNLNYEEIAGFKSPAIVAGGQIGLPQLEFLLTYDTNFTTTISRDVVFLMVERDQEGVRVAPLEVSVTINTVIKDFKDKDVSVLGMFNDGITDIYMRKVIMPASLNRRELYLDTIEWEPYKADQHTPDVFHLTNVSRMAGTLDSTRFAVTVEPAEDVMIDTLASMGWNTVFIPYIDVFDYCRPPAADTLYKYQADLVAGNSRGAYMGILDGRATAALDVTLHFNGNLLYPVKDTIGVIRLKFSYAEGSRDGTFNVNIYVKTRDKGDTIYLASADRVVRDGITLYPYNRQNGIYDGGMHLNYNEANGKTPTRYLQNFDDALSPLVYIEGDVFAIIDTLKFQSDRNIVLRGQDYSIMQVIRYSGSHYTFPGEACAYRGPMVMIEGDGKLTTYNMRFDGSGVSRIKPVYTTRQAYPDSLCNIFTNAQGATRYSYKPDKRVKDTTFSNGPVFLVRNGGTLTLNNKTSVLHNFNMATGLGRDTLQGAAIRVVGGHRKPTVTLSNQVLIAENVVSDAAALTNHKPSGAVHLQRASLQLGSSSATSCVTITDNFYSNGDSKFWKVSPTDDNKYLFDTTNIWRSRSNVYLTRTPGSPDAVINDDISDAVSFRYDIKSRTRIGVNKWFPGPTTRDTIQVARVSVSKQLYAKHAYENGNFINDSAAYTGDVFYHSTIGPYVLYLHRCASFKKQKLGDLLADLPNGTRLLQDSVMEYRTGINSSCPNGTDRMIYHVTGGFYPYTYTWSIEDGSGNDVTTLRTKKTPYTNDQVKKALSENNPEPMLLSNSDTAVLSDMKLSLGGRTGSFYYHVSAKDLAGCRLDKWFNVNVLKSTTDMVTVDGHDYAAPGLYYRSNNSDYICTDTNNHGSTTSGGIKLLRTFKALSFEVVAAPAGYGSVSANIAGESVNVAPGNDFPHCEGEQINLVATPTDSRYSFLMWDYDPQDNVSSVFTMPRSNTQLTAYFGCRGYWKDQVHTNPGSSHYRTDYNGNVHIYSANGLAWLISTVNGLNGQPAHSFFFDTVYIHDASHGGVDNYDMKTYRWTPVGTQRHPFKGTMVADDNVVISGVTINEPQHDYVGFFACADSARIHNVNLRTVMAIGSQYVGGLAANVTHSSIKGCKLTGENSESPIISTGYMSGGLVANADNVKFDNLDVSCKFIGTAIYSGGVVGYGNNSRVDNAAVWDVNRMAALYHGGAAGRMVGVQTTTDTIYTDTTAFDSTTVDTTGNGTGGNTHNAAKSLSGSKRIIQHYSSGLNNVYVHVQSEGKGQRVGGLIGYATGAEMQNNYVYGEAQGSVSSGALGAMIARNVTVDNCFYQESTARQAMGMSLSTGTTTNVSDFSGSGNQVRVRDAVGGVDNLTRVLNNWVRRQPSGSYNTWRSDLQGVNNGYPLFGIPDIVPVYDTIYDVACDVYHWNGNDYMLSGVYERHSTDSANFVDSIVLLNLSVYNSTTEQVADSVALGEDYSGYGFFLTADELRALRSVIDTNSDGTAVLHIADSLLTTHGCDSIVLLDLTLFVKGGGGSDAMEPVKAFPVSVYPNPTNGRVTIEADALLRVEIYDNVSRRVATVTAGEGNGHSVQYNLEALPSGAYFLRIVTTNGTAIKKLIKR